MHFFTGLNNWKQYRFKHFYLDASNSSARLTATENRLRCYTDKTNGSDLPPYIINITCKAIASFVIVETTYDTTEDGNTKGAILEICEIEVYGEYIDNVFVFLHVYQSLLYRIPQSAISVKT